MRSRWYHVPQLHMPSHHFEKKAGWLELFYDLIFVAAFIQLGNALAEKVSLYYFATFFAVFTPMWVAWTGFTWFSSRFNVDDFTHRALVFVKMISVGAMAVTGYDMIRQGWGGDYPHQGFAFAFAFAQAAVALFYLRSNRQQDKGREYSKYWGSVFAIGAALWLISAFVPAPYTFFLRLAGLAAIFFAPIHRQSRALAEQYPHDMEHLSERYGLLTLIVLGESFVKVLSELSQQGLEAMTLLQASGVLMITCGLWWIYFDDVAGSEIKDEKFSMPIWLYGHLPLQAGLVAVGVAIKKAILFDPDVAVPDKYRWLLCGSLAIVFFSAAVIDSVTQRKHSELSDRYRINARAFTGVLMLLLAAAGQGLSGLWFMVIITSICGLQVLFDMFMAPHEMEENHGAAPVADIKRKRDAGEAVDKRPRRQMSEAVRKGTPEELRKDLYFYLMDGPWHRIFIGSFLFFLLINLAFAALYMLDPGGIAEAKPQSFQDAFFFSVQTMSTIGYGTLHPVTDYANTVAIIEAAVGLLGVALITGLMFAKASRARSSVLFSNCMVTGMIDGKRTLMFRAGNARGNDLVDVTMTVTVLRDEMTSEGQHLRRFYDVPLIRSRTPFFSLTWSLIHEIDADSPFADVDFDGDMADIIIIAATVTGLDGTYGQTIYARHNYYPEDIHRNSRFVDVLSELPDGRLMVDYDKFHDTMPEDQIETLDQSDSGNQGE